LVYRKKKKKKKKMTRLGGWSMVKDATLGGRGNCSLAAVVNRLILMILPILVLCVQVC
jgi:hypothetical protein